VSRARKTFLIAGAAVGLVLGSGAAVFSDGPPWLMNTDGVMMPDGRRPYPTPTPKRRPHIPMRGDSAGVSYTYTQSAGSTTMLRDGKPWVTITQLAGGAVVIGDPNGPPGNVVRVLPKR
jgi:hypothetical protein